MGMFSPTMHLKKSKNYISKNTFFAAVVTLTSYQQQREKGLVFAIKVQEVHYYYFFVMSNEKIRWCNSSRFIRCPVLEGHLPCARGTLSSLQTRGTYDVFWFQCQLCPSSAVAVCALLACRVQSPKESCSILLHFSKSSPCVRAMCKQTANLQGQHDL